MAIKIRKKTSSKFFEKSFLVGYGSIGRRHLPFLYKYTSQIFVIDPKFSANFMIEKHLRSEKLLTCNSINELKVIPTSRDIVVVSNWGPDHFETILKFSELGVINFILEKPCVDSFEEIDKLIDLRRSKSLKILVNQGSYHANLGNRINYLGKLLGLGDIAAVWITGGARCLSTSGSHWISLVNQIFNSLPISVTADAEIDYINPRSKDLVFIEGVFSYVYTKRRRLSISLTNLSSISGRIEFYWPNHLGVLEGDSISVWSRQNSTNLSKITLHGKAEKKVFYGTIPYENQILSKGYKKSAKKNNFEQMDILYKKFTEGNSDYYDKVLIDHLNVNKQVLLSLVASDLGTKLEFKSNIPNELFTKKFGIS
jgi:predicted dehydrogenase